MSEVDIVAYIWDIYNNTYEFYDDDRRASSGLDLSDSDEQAPC